MGIRELALSRRQFLSAMGVIAGAGALALANTECDPAVVRRVVQSRTAPPWQHAAWVWQFSIDGAVDEIAPALAANNLAVVVKTHDGPDWMSTYDDAPGAIDGPSQVAGVAAMFERYGVPFHAWAVVKGVDPHGEAEMAADVLSAGARSLTLDLESDPKFWVGSNVDALRFCEDLRQRDEFARIDVAIDPRPWKMIEIPLAAFANFCDGIRPQLYWDVFNTPDHVNAYTYMGFPPGPDGITPEFLVDTTRQLLAPFDRWIVPIAQGSAADAALWPRLAHEAWMSEMPVLNVWRYGTVDAAVLQYLAANPAGTEPNG